MPFNLAGDRPVVAADAVRKPCLRSRLLGYSLEGAMLVTASSVI
jgi:hypothetical protein